MDDKSNSFGDHEESKDRKVNPHSVVSIADANDCDSVKNSSSISGDQDNSLSGVSLKFDS